MDKWRKLGIILLIIFFPLGILYCLIHTLGRDFPCFLGGLFMCGIGVLIGIHIMDSNLIPDFIFYVLSLIPFK
jgi:hypothetical protein